MICLEEKDVTDLPESQQRALLALVGDPAYAPTYIEAAKYAGIHVGTLKSYLKRTRENYPEIYKLAFVIRRWQLIDRHKQAVERAAEHSHQYHKGMMKHTMKYLKKNDNHLDHLLRREYASQQPSY